MLPAFDWNGGPLQLESLAGIVGIRTESVEPDIGMALGADGRPDRAG